MLPSKPSPSRSASVSRYRWLVLGLSVVYLAHRVTLGLVWWRAAAPGELVARISGSRVSRDEVLSVARAYAEHSWTATPQNVRHGSDTNGIDVQTPDGPAGQTVPGKWQIGSVNVGMPYKWGGFDTPETFDAGLAEGKAAGDIYSITKRRLGNSAVSADAVGIDCSGFICRCWGLSEKYGTTRLPGFCRALRSTDDLLPGDVMDSPNGHVVLFVRWLDGLKFNALFYEAEAEPQPKVVLSQHNLLWLRVCGARPFRFRGIGD